MSVPITPKGWRPKWFQEGKKYKVIRDIKEELKTGRVSSFAPSEVVIFDSEVYSIYDSCTGYIFEPIEPPNSSRKIIDLYDDDNLPAWSDYFQLLD
jgi:hypothetical protein